MDWGYIITIILTVGFGVATIILTFKVTKRKRPVWAFSTRHIIGRDAEAPPELKYVFGNKEVSEVYKTTIIFFNMGTDKFCGDLVPAGNSDLNEAIIIQFKEAEILRPPTIPSRSKGAVNFSVEQVKSPAGSVQLHIPILNHNGGAIIEVWHTQCKEIDIPNADVKLLKEFIRERPKNLYRSTIVSSIFIVFLLSLAGFVLATMKSFDESVPILILFAVFIVGVVWDMLKTFRYKSFPGWSRRKEELSSKF